MMENEIAPNSTNPTSNNSTIIIILLLVLLIFSFLGINIFIILGNFVQIISNIFGPAVLNVLSIFGYSTGTIIDKSSEIGTNAAKTGLDIIDGTLDSVGNLFKKASSAIDDESKRELDRSINNGPGQTPLAPVNNTQAPPPEVASPDDSSNPIQNPIATSKTSWCLVGEYQGRRGCIEISEQDKCLSGQVFPEQKMCLNPTLTNNMNQLNLLKSVSE
jgi:hypothetical protein